MDVIRRKTFVVNKGTDRQAFYGWHSAFWGWVTDDTPINTYHESMSLDEITNTLPEGERSVTLELVTIEIKIIE